MSAADVTWRTVGVEEEFLLMRAASAQLVGDGDGVVDAAAENTDGQFEHELKREQAELATSPHACLAELATELGERRAQLAEAARRRGVRLVALATSPLEDPSTATPDPRYELMTRLLGRVARLQLTCGMHVHVMVASPDEGVAVLDRLRPWLSVLVALSANSPYLLGEDTGYASYRTVLWGQWPTAGPTEPFGDAAAYEAVRADLVASGAALDDAMVYFDARLSAKYPTVEIRAADVCPHSADAATIAGLCRGLVSTAAREWARGTPCPAARTETLRAASWRAARWGAREQLYDVRSGRLVDAWDLVEELVDWVSPALRETGDLGRVRAGLDRIRARGTGAHLQREVFGACGDLRRVVDEAARWTLAEE